ncbi:MAG: hypothetical protein AAF968_01720 [Pseudomonadota bacterium]
MFSRLSFFAALVVALIGLGISVPGSDASAAGFGFRSGVSGAGSTGSGRVAAVQRGPRSAGALGARIRSTAPSYNNGPGLERPRTRPRHRRPGRHFRHRRYGYGFPYGFGYDTREREVVVVTPPPEPEEPEAEPEPDPMPLAQPKRVRAGGSIVGSDAAGTTYAVTLEAEGANAGSTAQRLTEQRDTLVAALILAGADFCVAREGGLAIQRSGDPGSFRGTLDLDLRATDTEGLLLALAGLPPETIASIREGNTGGGEETRAATRRKPAPFPGQRCV